MKNEESPFLTILERASRAPISVAPKRRAALKRALARRVSARRSPYVSYLRLFVPVVLASFVFALVGQGYLPVTDAGKARAALRSSDRALAVLTPDDRARLERALGVDPSVLIAEARRGRNLSVASEMQDNTADAAAAPMLMMASDVGYEAGAGALEEPLPEVASRKAGGPDDTDVAAFAAPPTFMLAAAPEESLPPAVSFIRFEDSEGNTVTLGFDEAGIPVYREVGPPAEF